MAVKVDPEYSDTMTLLELIRVTRNLSRQRLAGIADIGLGTIYGAERMGRRPHRSTVRALAHALDVDYQWLAASFDDVERPAAPLQNDTAPAGNRRDVTTSTAAAGPRADAIPRP